MKAAQYREMLAEELSSVSRPVTERAQVVRALEAFWIRATTDLENGTDPHGRAPARLLWAGLGLLAYGNLDRVETMLETIARYPDAIRHKPCRYYASALQSLIPFPATIVPSLAPADAIAWFRTVRDRLRWDEERGEFFEAEAVVVQPALRRSLIEDAMILSQPFIGVDHHVFDAGFDVGALFARCRAENVSVLIPDHALYELYRCQRTFPAWRECLRELSHAPELVSFGYGIGDLLRHEIARGEPIGGAADPIATKAYRGILASIQSGDDVVARTGFEQSAAGIDEEVAKRQAGADAQSYMTELRSRWDALLTPRAKQRLRAHDDAVVLDILTDPDLAEVVIIAAISEGCTTASARHLAFSPSVFAHLLYGQVALVLESWRLDVLDPSAEGRWADLRQLDYVCGALTCRDLVSPVDHERRLWHLLRAAVARRVDPTEEPAAPPDVAVDPWRLSVGIDPLLAAMARGTARLHDRHA